MPAAPRHSFNTVDKGEGSPGRLYRYRLQLVVLRGTKIGGIQLLIHEIMPVSDGVLLKRPKDAIPEFFVEGSRLKTEGVEECVRAAPLDRTKLRTLHQVLAKAMPARRRGYCKRSDV